MQHFLVGYTNHPPFVRPHLENKQNDIWIVRGGADYHLINVLSRKYNFTYEFIYMHNQYELLMNDFDHNTIDPSIRLSLNDNKTIDIGIGGWTLTYERSQNVEHLYPYLVEQTSIMTAVPEYHQPNPRQLFEPFDSFIWLGVFGSLILFFLLGRFGQCFKKSNSNLQNFNLFWIQVQVLFRQPVHQIWFREPHETNDRLLILSIWMFIVMILSSAYGGCLFSIMTIPHHNNIDTIDELVEQCNQNRIIVLVENGTASMIEIQTSQRSLMTILNKHLQVVQYQLWAAEMILNASMENDNGNDHHNQRYAFIQQYTMLKHLQMIYGRHRLYLPKSNNDHSSLIKTLNVILLRKSFPLAREFDKINSRLFNAGLYQLWLEREFLQNKSISQSIVDSVSLDNNNNSTENSEIEEKEKSYEITGETYTNEYYHNRRIQTLSLEQLTIFFYLYLCLIFVCLLIFFVECIWLL
ncbi:uncharacterized protein LOC113788469 [Dermatophagoides pteronyssinus]|uniref:uncharacterized protein LOC113788469 n=1 Tax=Dermatophagoides pteronyssinus TaxID=6956 RepID=UPI003F66E182